MVIFKSATKVQEMNLQVFWAGAWGNGTAFYFMLEVSLRLWGDVSWCWRKRVGVNEPCRRSMSREAPDIEPVWVRYQLKNHRIWENKWCVLSYSRELLSNWAKASFYSWENGAVERWYQLVIRGAASGRLLRMLLSIISLGVRGEKAEKQNKSKQKS